MAEIGAACVSGGAPDRPRRLFHPDHLSCPPPGGTRGPGAAPAGAAGAPLDVAAARDSAKAALNAAKANLEQGEAEMREAESAYRRAQDLFAKKFISESTLDSARARHDKARASISSLKAAIGVAETNVRSASVSVEQTLIRAPFEGIVLTKNANVGDIITPFSSAPGTTGAVVNMADMETLEVEADVVESSIGKIRTGMPTEVQLDAYPELRLLGEVSRVVPTVDRSKATLLVKVTFKETDPRVLPDMSAKVGFLERAPEAGERKPLHLKLWVQLPRSRMTRWRGLKCLPPNMAPNPKSWSQIPANALILRQNGSRKRNQ